MEEFSETQIHPQLLDLIPKETEWAEKGISEEQEQAITSCEEHKLELRLGPPGVEFSPSAFPGNKQKLQALDPANTAVLALSQKRSDPALGPVVGWPPIRSFRKNHHANTNNSSFSKLLRKNVVEKKQIDEIRPKAGLLVKINMDGVPIGRKVDLKTHDNYQKLSSAVDQLFRCLLADGIQNNDEGEKVIPIIGESGEYKLVYEDMEGDKMLVGDVPWNMFVSNVKRLRVMKTSDISKLFG
jgi:hypothetical protein